MGPLAVIAQLIVTREFITESNYQLVCVTDIVLAHVYIYISTPLRNDCNILLLNLLSVLVCHPFIVVWKL